MTRTILMNSWKMVEFAFGPENANHTETFDFIKSLSMFGIHNFISSPSHNLFSVDSVWTISSSENNSFIVDIYVNDSTEQQKKRLHFKNHKSNCHTNRSGQKKNEPASCNARFENTTRILLLPNAIYISIKTYTMFSVFPLDFVYYNNMLRFALYLFH